MNSTLPVHLDKKTVFKQWMGFPLKKEIELEKGNYRFTVEMPTLKITTHPEGREMGESKLDLTKITAQTAKFSFNQSKTKAP